MKKKCVVLLLAVVCLFSAVGVRGYAVQVLSSEQIRICSASMSRSSNGRLGISFSIQGTTVMDTLGTSSIVVQRLSGTSWVSEYTFNVSYHPEMQAQNKSSHSATMLYTPKYSGAKYRAMVFFYARNSYGSDTAVETTNSI